MPTKKPIIKIISPCTVDTVAADKSCPTATAILLAGETKTSFINPLTISSTVDEARFSELSNTVAIITPESI